MSRVRDLPPIAAAFVIFVIAGSLIIAAVIGTGAGILLAPLYVASGYLRPAVGTFFAFVVPPILGFVLFPFASGSRRGWWGLLAAAWVGFAAATIYLIGL
jgi:hypothetical protein